MPESKKPAKSVKAAKAASTVKKVTKTAAVKPTRATARVKTVETDQPVIHRTSEKKSLQIGSRLKNAGQGLNRTMRQRTTWYWIGGILGIVAAMLILTWQWQRSYVAKVGNQYITTAMVDDQLRASYGSSGVNSVVQQQLILQEGDRKHITIAKSDIDQEIAKITQSSGGQESYQSQLKQLGISEELLRYQIKVEKTREKLVEDKIQVTDKEIQDYYDQNKTSIDPDGTTGLDGLKEQIQMTIRQQKLDDAGASLVDSLRNQTHVETNLNHYNLTFWNFIKQDVIVWPQTAWNYLVGKR